MEKNVLQRNRNWILVNILLSGNCAYSSIFILIVGKTPYSIRFVQIVPQILQHLQLIMVAGTKCLIPGVCFHVSGAKYILFFILFWNQFRKLNQKLQEQNRSKSLSMVLPEFSLVSRVFPSLSREDWCIRGYCHPIMSVTYDIITIVPLHMRLSFVSLVDCLMHQTFSPISWIKQQRMFRLSQLSQALKVTGNKIQ